MSQENIQRRKIEQVRAKIRELRREIRKQEHRLADISEVAIQAFNEISEPFDGVVVDQIHLGSRLCDECPLGICVYSDEREPSMSIPGQRRWHTWMDEHRGTPEEYSCPHYPEMGTNACLFCGIPGQPEEH